MNLIQIKTGIATIPESLMPISFVEWLYDTDAHLYKSCNELEEDLLYSIERIDVIADNDAFGYDGTTEWWESLKAELRQEGCAYFRINERA